MSKNQDSGLHKSVINWFPGHMKKAYVKIEEYLKMIDFVIIVLDARAPFSSANDYLIKVFAQKPKLYLLNKEDLGDPKSTKFWLNYYNKEEIRSIAINSKKSLKKELENQLVYLTEAKRQKNLKKGIKNSIYKGMIVGIPNVGKSTIINQLIGKKRVETANKPGVTRSVNWIKISKEYFIMDTPGILTPRFENAEESIKLALLGSIRQEILPLDSLIKYGVDFLKKYYPEELLNYLDEKVDLKYLESIESTDVIKVIANKFMPRLKDGVLNIDQAKLKFLNDFRDSQIAKLCLDKEDQYA